MIKTKKTKQTIGLACALVVFCVVSPDASAKDFNWSGGSWTQVTGYTATGTKTTTGWTGYVITGFQWWEKKDDPVRIQVSARKLCSGSCSGNKTTELETGINAGNIVSVKNVATAESHYITGIQVCTTNKNNTSDNKLKGIRLWSARIKPAGKFVADPSPKSAYHAHCVKWGTIRKCASGQFVTGIKAYYGPKTGFTGFEVRCSTVDLPKKEKIPKTPLVPGYSPIRFPGHNP